MSSIAEIRIAEVLADPIVKLMMRADGVDRNALADELRATARRLKSDAADDEGGDEPPGWLAAKIGHLKSTASGACCR